VTFVDSTDVVGLPRLYTRSRGCVSAGEPRLLQVSKGADMDEEREAPLDELETAMDAEQENTLGDAKTRVSIDPICLP
jgi:hypothetical protein